MFGWALIFVVIAAIALIFGYSGIAVVAGSIAQLLFLVLIALFVAALIFDRRTPMR